MSQNDYMEVLPEGFRAVGHSDKCPYAAIENVEKGFYATQFHPEVNHTEQGFDMLGNFLYKVCHCKGDWTMKNYAEEAIKQATGYTVTCYQYQIDILKKDAAVIYNDCFGIYILNDSAYYDDKLGLNLDAIGGEGVFY